MRGAALYLILTAALFPASIPRVAAQIPTPQVEVRAGESVAVHTTGSVEQIVGESVVVDPAEVAEARLVVAGGLMWVRVECRKEGTATLTFNRLLNGRPGGTLTYLIRCRGAAPPLSVVDGEEPKRASMGPGTTVVKAAPRDAFIMAQVDNLASDGGIRCSCNRPGESVVEVSYLLRLSGTGPIRLPNPNIELVTLSDGRVIGVPKGQGDEEILSYRRLQRIICIRN